MIPTFPNIYFPGKKVIDDNLTSGSDGKGVKRKLDESSDDDTSDSDYDVEENVTPQAAAVAGAGAKQTKKDGFEVVAQNPGKEIHYKVSLSLKYHRTLRPR